MCEEERNLIRRLAERDPLAEREFVEKWDPRITRWVAQRAQPHKVEEYTQEVWGHRIAGNYLRLLQWKALYDDEAWHEHSLESFLKQITRNKVLDLVDAEPPQLPQGLDPNDIIDRTTPLGTDPLIEAERERLMSAYTSCADRFNDNDHRSIRMWWEGHTARHIAAQLDTNPNNVYQRRSYLLRQLRACLVEMLPEYFRHV